MTSSFEQVDIIILYIILDILAIITIILDLFIIVAMANIIAISVREQLSYTKND